MTSHSTQLPRVLVVNTWPFNRATNMGSTLCNLFDGYEADKLAAVDFCPSTHADPSLPANVWRFARPILDGHRFGRQWRRLERNSEIETSANDPTGTALSRVRSRGKAYDWRTHLGPLLNEFVFAMPGILSPEFVRWVDDFAPDVLFSQAAPGHLLGRLLTISRRWNLPIVPHFTDDWVEWYPPAPAVARRYIQSIARRRFRQVLERSPIRLVISSLMAREYQQRYGGAFQVVMCPCVTSPPNALASNKLPFVIVFTGVLEPGRWRTLVELGKAIDSLSIRDRMQLHVYAPYTDLARHSVALESCPNIRVKGFVSTDQLPHVLQSADALLHVESFEQGDLKRTRLAMSTKIGLYLSTGRPVIAVGPAEAASIQYFSQIKVGPVSCTPTVQTLAHTLMEFFLNRRMHSVYCDNARQHAELFFNPDVVRKGVWDLLASAVRVGTFDHG